MARKKKQLRDELEELDEAYTGLAGSPPKGKGCSTFFSLLLILLIVGGILVAVYWLASGALINA